MSPMRQACLARPILLPAWMLKGHDGILAVDIGGTNIRAGVVELNLKKATDLAKAEDRHTRLWRHGDEDTNREGAVEHLTECCKELISWSRKNKIELLPSSASVAPA